MSFHIRLFPGKTNGKIFQKIEISYLGAIFGPFCPNLCRNEFSWKKGSVSFEVFQLSTIMQKNQKKLMSHSQEKCQTDR